VDRRSEARVYMQQLQQRVFERYWETLLELSVRENSLMHFGKDSFDPRDYLRMAIGQSSSAPLGLGLGLGPRNSFPHTVSLTSEQVNQGQGLNNQIAAGFAFIMQLKGQLVVSLPKQRFEEDLLFAMQSNSLLNTCTRNMLVAFDAGAYDEAQRMGEAIVSFVDDNEEGINWASELSLSIFGGKKLVKMADFLRSIPVLVTKLNGPYTYAAKTHKWTRMAGTFHDVAQISASATKFTWPTLKIFLRQLRPGIEYALERKTAQGVGYVFTTETLYDPLMAILQVLLSLTRGGSHTEKALHKGYKRYVQLLQIGKSHVHAAHLSPVFSFLRQRKYDALRSDMLEVFLETVRITEAFARFEETAGGLSEVNHDVYCSFRFYQLPLLKYKLLPYLRLLFGGVETLSACTVNLSLCLSVLETDLVMAAHFDERFSNFLFKADGAQSRCYAAEKYASAEEIITHGRWCFEIGFYMHMSGCLKHWTVGKERKRLAVIVKLLVDGVINACNAGAADSSRVTDTPSVTSLLVCEESPRLQRLICLQELEMSLPSLAYELLQALHALPTALSECAVTETLHSLLVRDADGENNHGESAGSTGALQRPNSEGRRIHKLVVKLHAAVQGFPAEEVLAVRASAVSGLLQLMQTAACKRSARPPGTLHIFEASPSPHQAGTSRYNPELMRLLKEAAQSLHPWSQEDVRYLRKCVAQLETTTEQVTCFFSNTLGGNFPEQRAVSNAKWTLEAASKATAALWRDTPAIVRVVRDLYCIHKIISAVLASDGGPHDRAAV